MLVFCNLFHSLGKHRVKGPEGQTAFLYPGTDSQSCLSLWLFLSDSRAVALNLPNTTTYKLRTTALGYALPCGVVDITSA